MGKKLYNENEPGLHVTYDALPELMKAIKRLVRDEVLVGVPAENTERDDPESKAAGITNASLAYIHDNGAPEMKIPARPFMIPGMERSKPHVIPILTKTAQYALAAQPGKIKEGFERVGLVVVDNIHDIIQEGIPPPLAPSTLKKRAAKGRKGAQKELDRRGQGIAPGLDLAKPLLDTGEMNKAIVYVIRKRSDRSST